MMAFKRAGADIITYHAKEVAEILGKSNY